MLPVSVRSHFPKLSDARISRRLGVAVVLAGLGAVFGLHCQERPNASAGVYRFVDDLGREISLSQPVHRVVTLAPNLTEMVFAAGAGDRLVGVSTADDYPAAISGLPRFSAFPLNVEAVAALEPDLVLATDQVNSSAYEEAFRAAGIPVAYLSFPGLEDVWVGVERVGSLLGTAERAKGVADSLRAVVGSVRIGSREGDSAYVLVLVGDEVLYAFGSESYLNDVVTAAGAQSLTSRLPGAAATLSEEWVLQANPDVIVGTFGPDYEPSRLVALHPAWESLPAVRPGNLCLVDPDWLLRPGPRLALGAQAIARCVARWRAARGA